MFRLIVAELLVVITNICCVYWLNYYIIAKNNTMAPIKKKSFKWKEHSKHWKCLTLPCIVKARGPYTTRELYTRSRESV
jgi:hypothetical protein